MKTTKYEQQEIEKYFNLEQQNNQAAQNHNNQQQQ